MSYSCTYVGWTPMRVPVSEEMSVMERFVSSNKRPTLTPLALVLTA